MNDEQPQILRVGLRGTLVTCRSLDDAMAIKRAGEILDAGRFPSGSPFERFVLMDALNRCGQQGAAEDLRGLAECEVRVRDSAEADWELTLASV
jgi:hypothetical protein